MLRQVIFPVIWRRIKSYADQVEDLRRYFSPHCKSICAHFLYFSTFFMFGMSVGMAGPTLTDYLISFFTNIDIIDALSWLLFTQSTFRFVGAIVAGTLIDRYDFNRNLLLLCFLLLNAIFLAVIPICRTLWLLILSTAAAGFSVGILDTATNVQLIAIHGKKVSPYLQALYFSYGFGAFVSPLIAEPFLSGSPHPDLGLPAAKRGNPLPYGGMGHRSHHKLSHRPTNHMRDTFSTGSEEYKSEVQVAYWIIALAHLPVVVGLAYIVIADKWAEHKLRQAAVEAKAEKERRSSDIPDAEVQGVTTKVHLDKETLKKPGLCDNPNKTQVLCITFWTSFLVFLYDGMQGSYGGYVYTYAVKSSLRMTSAQGAFLTSVFWGSLALGRLVSIPIALFLSPAVMLLVDLIGCLVSSLLMLVFRASESALWMGTSTFGLFMSNVFPTSVALAEQYFNVTGTVTCMFVVSAAIGEMIIPLIVGKVFDYVGPISFLAEGCILCFAAFGAYLAVLILGKGAASHDVSRREVLGEGKDGCEEDEEKPVGETEQDSDQLISKDKSPNR
ncbi:major facilitator superfamily domain-containing protein 4A-like isoform X2 [Pocillopora damicornis]|uniref:major facilitator superfamily domain-containing protein 4A-like isoform X2 n=1 Tax=Pocillopora damicornis TaxID=46731 RepID=UPI000F552551|nr:major facilitator superfamily domain-containing protein 4A-like isoform X2 [Pocillopora damicornis]